MRSGTVYLVGAGPGDPQLMTRRGYALLREADCVIYDRLVNPEALRCTKRGCEKIYVGKSHEAEGHSQGQINRLLLKKVRRHRRVVRLKGGDAALFSRIGEELDVLSRARIPFEIVPGVSSAWAAATAMGIPLTDRRYSSSVAIVTGQEAREKSCPVRRARMPMVRWERLARAVDTLVILMGATTLSSIVKKLRKAGRPVSTPIALIRWATWPQQEIILSTLGDVTREMRRRPLFGPPFVAVVGDVVRLSRKFRPLPLKGKKILVTRAASDSLDMTQRLESLGASCLHLPTIRISPRAMSRKEAIEISKRCATSDWVIFPSRHGVEALERVTRRTGISLSSAVKGRICVVGPRTAEAARQAGLKVDLVPTDFSAKGIEQRFRLIPVKGRRIMIPRSLLGVGDHLAQLLRRRGAVVEEVILYETTHPAISPRRVKGALERIDAATFTSASTVHGFIQALAAAKIPLKKALNGAHVVAIGSATAGALRRSGIFNVHLPKDAGTVEGLVRTVVEALRSC